MKKCKYPFKTIEYFPPPQLPSHLMKAVTAQDASDARNAAMTKRIAVSNRYNTDNDDTYPEDYARNANDGSQWMQRQMAMMSQSMADYNQCSADITNMANKMNDERTALQNAYADMGLGDQDVVTGDGFYTQENYSAAKDAYDSALSHYNDADNECTAFDTAHNAFVTSASDAESILVKYG